MRLHEAAGDEQTETGAGAKFLQLFWARVQNPSGTTNMDFELNQKSCDPAATPTNCATNGKNVTPETALEHVAGYTIFNDLSARDVQRAESRSGNHLLGKNFDTAGPMGPYLVTADEIPDPGRLELELRVNGELRQRGNTAQMIYSLPRLIAHWSQMTLYPGDVVTTGTPAGVAVGRGDNSWYLRAGDVVEATIAGLGTLQNTIRPA